MILTELAAAVQVNIVPATFAVNKMAVVSPEQIDTANGVVVNAGFGFTVTMTLAAVPMQLFAVGVTV